MANYQLGPCAIYVQDIDANQQPVGTATDLGKTFGGVTISAENTTQELKTDQDGDVPVDEIISSRKVTVEANLADISLDNLAVAFNTSVVVDSVDSAKKKVEVNVGTGFSLISNAKRVIIKPIIGGAPSTNANDWITLPVAGVKAEGFELVYDNSTQRAIKATFTSYPRASDGMVVIFGDETATP